MSNIDKQALRERYSEKPAPKCHICWSVMTIQRASAGSIVYGCTGRIDKDGEGYKFAEGRDFADDHYARSRVTEYGPGGDPEVLALLDDLAAAEHAAAVDHEAACSLVEENEEVKRKLAAAEKRIAELEQREVKLPPTFWYEHDDLPREIPVLSRRLVINALREAGVKVAAGIGKGE